MPSLLLSLTSQIPTAIINLVHTPPEKIPLALNPPDALYQVQHRSQTLPTIEYEDKNEVQVFEFLETINVPKHFVHQFKGRTHSRKIARLQFLAHANVNQLIMYSRNKYFCAKIEEDKVIFTRTRRHTNLFGISNEITRILVNFPPNFSILGIQYSNILELNSSQRQMTVFELLYPFSQKGLGFENELHICQHCKQYQKEESQNPDIDLQLIQSSDSSVLSQTIAPQQVFNAVVQTINETYRSTLEVKEAFKYDLSRPTVQKINMIQLNKFNSLNLSNSKLTSTKELINITFLTELDLGHNQLESLSGIESLTSLQKLNVSKNKLESLKEIQSFKNLVMLKAGHNRLKSFDISQCQSLQIIDFKRNQLQGIEGIQQTCKLVELNVSNNYLNSLSFLKFAYQLQKLWAKSNQLCDISDISNLTNLTKLDISVNKIQSIKPVFILLNLKELICSHNQILDINKIFMLQNLLKLDIVGNKIKSIAEVAKQQNLQQLKIRKNLIQQLPDLSNLLNLIRLDISRNAIHTLDPIKNLTSLQWFSCRFTRVSTMKQIQSFRNLTYLNIDQTWISKFEEFMFIRNLKNLTFFSCLYTKLSDGSDQNRRAFAFAACESIYEQQKRRYKSELYNGEREKNKGKSPFERLELGVKLRRNRGRRDTFLGEIYKMRVEQRQVRERIRRLEGERGLLLQLLLE